MEWPLGLVTRGSRKRDFSQFHKPTGYKNLQMLLSICISTSVLLKQGPAPSGLTSTTQTRMAKGFPAWAQEAPAQWGHFSRHVMGPNIVIITSQEEFDFKFRAFYTSDPQKLTRHLQILGPAGRPQDLGHTVVLTVPVAQALPVDMACFNAHCPPSKQLLGAWPHAPSCPSTGKDTWAPGKEHA